MSSWWEARWHTGRHGVGEVAESSVSGSARQLEESDTEPGLSI